MLDPKQFHTPFYKQMRASSQRSQWSPILGAVGKVIGGVLVLAASLALLLAFFYGVVRFVHWAWYQ
jgi:hypothetical protein